MTNRAAVNWLINLMSDIGKSQHGDLWHYEQALAEIKKMLEEEPQWIPCSERLPEEGQIVLATHLGGLDPSRQVIEHIYSGGKFLLNWEMDMEMLSPTFGQRYMGKVIAWMPLPEPWEGDAE